MTAIRPDQTFLTGYGTSKRASRGSSREGDRPFANKGDQPRRNSSMRLRASATKCLAPRTRQHNRAYPCAPHSALSVGSPMMLPPGECRAPRVASSRARRKRGFLVVHQRPSGGNFSFAQETSAPPQRIAMKLSWRRCRALKLRCGYPHVNGSLEQSVRRPQPDRMAESPGRGLIRSGSTIASQTVRLLRATAS